MLSLLFEIIFTLKEVGGWGQTAGVGCRVLGKVTSSCLISVFIGQPQNPIQLTHHS